MPPGRLLSPEETAKRAATSYMAVGPSRPYETMSWPALSAMRSQLDAYPTANNRAIGGWITVEQAFSLVGQDPEEAGRVDHYIGSASDSFATSIDMYDGSGAYDEAEHPWRTKIALGALPLYEEWISQTVPSKDKVQSLQTSTLEAGHKIVELKAGSQWGGEADKSFRGFAAEVLTLLAYNRRQQDVTGAELSFAVPSTFRQRKSNQPGLEGNRFSKNRLRGNWHVSLVEQQAGGLALSEKLHVIPAFNVPPDRIKMSDPYGYTEDLTVVSVEDHLCRGLEIDDTWEALRIMLSSTERGTSQKYKKLARAMTSNLYERIAVGQEIRATKDGSTLHVYHDEPM